MRVRDFLPYEQASGLYGQKWPEKCEVVAETDRDVRITERISSTIPNGPGQLPWS